MIGSAIMVLAILTYTDIKTLPNDPVIVRVCVFDNHGDGENDLVGYFLKALDFGDLDVKNFCSACLGDCDMQVRF